MAAPVTLRSSAAHVLVPDLDAPALSGEDAHHLRRVLRLRDGDAVTATDGQGDWRVCRLAGDGLVPDGERRHEPRPAPAVTVAFAPVKGDRPEWVVRRLTEIGVERIVPLRCDRAVVRWEGERADRQVDRLRRVAHEALMQSRRCHLPDVTPVTSFTEMLEAPGACLAEPGGAPPSLTHPVVLVGPEGGWSPAELEAAAVVGAPRIGLGPHVLRAETACLVAAALLVATRSSVG